MRDIATELSGRWFTVMVDETTDLSNTEQLVFCIRYVDDCLNVHEEPVGFYCLESTSADSIMTTIQDILLRLFIIAEVSVMTALATWLEPNREYILK